MARNIEQIGGRDNNLNIIEDVFEAFVGALSIEADQKICEKFVVTLMEQQIDIPALIHIETNFKDSLLQYYHKMKWPDPEYCSVNVTENNNKKIFKMAVKGYFKIGDKYEWRNVGEGIGSSKKKGEQEAAKMALIKYGVIKENDDDSLYEEVYETSFQYN